jgi:hypothetical protein
MPVRIAARNAGPGPAVIKSAVFYADRKAIKDGREAGIKYGGPTEDGLDYVELEQDDALAVGQTVWLIQYQKPCNTKRRNE